MEKSKDRENRFRDKGTRKHKAETQKLTFPFRSQQRGHCLAGAVGRQSIFYGPA